MDLDLGEKEYVNEIEILKNFDHPNILKIYEFYQDKERFYMITEFCEMGKYFRFYYYYYCCCC
jgi:serine/threonine protein kinase